LDSAEVVVIGGGVMGTSIAYHLVSAGVTDVLLLERDTLASGSSGKPLGGVRAQFSGAGNVRLGARSLEAFGRFASTMGVDIGLQRVGYLFLLRTDDDVAAFEAGVAQQNELGVPSRMITPAQARGLNPYVGAGADLKAAAYSPDDGYAKPARVVQAYADSAATAGARIRTATEVIGIDVHDHRVVAVHTPEGPIATGTVVCAAGAWSAAIGAMAGVHLPVEPLRRQITFTAPISPAPPRIPFTIDFDSTFYFHNGDGGSLLLGLAEAGQPVGFDTDYEARWLPALREAAARCAPDLSGMAFERGWAGLYEQTPDRDALIGRATSVDGFLYATGFSGHGFLQAPAVGEVVRDLYLGVEPFCDISEFSAARFSDGSTHAELAIV
jgi:sarcosine oxidase, subunit beta